VVADFPAFICVENDSVLITRAKNDGKDETSQNEGVVFLSSLVTKYSKGQTEQSQKHFSL
jgi:hypothetical protein